MSPPAGGPAWGTTPPTVDARDDTALVVRFVPAEILRYAENNAIDLLVLEVQQDSTDITRAAAEILLILFGRFHAAALTGHDLKSLLPHR